MIRKAVRTRAEPSKKLQNELQTCPYLLDIPANGTLYLREGERPVSYQVEKGVFEIRNMTPGEEVTYLLKDEDGKRTKAGLLYPTG